MNQRLSLPVAAVALATPGLLIGLAVPAILLTDGPGMALAFVALAASTLSVASALAGIWIAARGRNFLAQLTDSIRGLPTGDAPTIFGGFFREEAEIERAFNTMAAQWRASRNALAHQAYHDQLTGLANRAAFMSRVSDALSRSGRREKVAVLFIDLDRFKAVNDSLGHGVGDGLLAAVAARLTAATGPNGLVARFGGDEFTVMVQGAAAESRAQNVAQDILDRLRLPITASGYELFVNASIGIAVASHAMPATELLRRSDVALYRAKEQGRGCYVLFDVDDHDIAPESLHLGAALRHAIERDELTLVYQPVVDLATGNITGAEALLRWNHPHLGVLPPGQFIDLAEESGEIVRLSQWVIERAARDAATLRAAVPDPSGFAVGINLSSREFLDPSLPARISAALAQADLPGEGICVELLEGILVSNIQTATEVISNLHAIGVEVAIDDFGTGYSSLSYLQALTVDVLKIDQSFVARIGHDARSGPIITAILDLAGALGMHVIAEGVETREQATHLRRAGCISAQGHHFAQAMPLDEFVAVLELSLTAGRYAA